MATYPSSPAFVSRVTPITKLRHQVAESGVVRATSLSEADAYRITVTHDMITASEVATLQTFYGTNRYADNVITASDGDAYDCWFESDYDLEVISASWFRATVTLLASRQ